MIVNRDKQFSIMHQVFGATRGGIERDVLAMISASPEINHIVIVFGASGPMVEEWQSQGARVEVLGDKSANTFAFSTKLSNVIKKYRPNGFIAWFGLVKLPQIIRVCNLLKIKLVVHAGNPAHSMSFATNIRYWLLSKLLRPAGFLPVYACCSEYVTRSFESSLYLKQFPRTTIYNGIEFPIIPTHVPRDYVRDQPFVIGMTARLSPTKDHATLLHAFAMLAQDYPNVMLELAGDGSLRKSLETLTRRLGISHRVTFLGDVANIYSVLSRWDLFAYSTTENEGLGNAVSEAMAFGVPCVITDVGPMREFNSKTEDCVLFAKINDPVAMKNALVQLILDKDARSKLSDASIRLAHKKFCPVSFAKRHLKLLGVGNDRRKKILHIAFGAERGGVEGNARAAIATLKDIDHQVVVFGNPGPMVEDWQSAGAEVLVLGSNSAGFFTMYRRLMDILARIRPDGVIAWFGLVQLPQIIRACNRSRTKLVVHAGNPAHTMSIATNFRYWLVSKIYQPSGKLPIYGCCSNYVAKSFDSSIYLRKFPRTVIFNGIELPKESSHFPRKFDPGTPFIIGMTARLNPIKDHATLLKAFALVFGEFPNVELELAGEGILRNELEVLANRLGVSSHVKFLGDVSEIYDVMGKWDLFAYATTEREGLGNAVSEAMAIGLPCVITDVGPMREFHNGQFSIRLVPPDDPQRLALAIIEVMQSLTLRQQMTSAGKLFVRENFTAEKFAQKYAATIDCVDQNH